MATIRGLLDWMENCTRVYESTDAGVPLVMPAPPCAELSARELFNAALVARDLAWMLERAAVAGAGAGLDPGGELAQILRVKFEQHEADTPGAVFAQFVGAHAFETPSTSPGSSTQVGAGRST